MSHLPTPRRSRLRAGSRTAAAAVTTAALCVLGLTGTPAASSAPSVQAAQSAPSAQCPLPYPVAEVTKGQRVTGLTVTSGTEPTGFTGEVLGVVRDGIAPGLDMVLARFTSPEIDRVGGIWQGMSGSPVYAADGRLVGAVSYGLGTGASPVAGITPAAEMYRMLSEPPTATAAARASRQAVSLPRGLARRLTGRGVLTRREATAGMTRLPTPLGVSGMVTARRLGQLENALGLSGVQVHRSGAVTAASDELPIVVGGNLAASLSYGDVSTVNVGTVTAICGDEVLAFGHAMNFTGPARMTMHGADAVYIQEDPLGLPFKQANAGAPVGSVTQDRLAGLFGIKSPSAAPATTAITSYVEVPGEWSRTGTTYVSAPDSVPEVASFHLLADQDRVFDGTGKGTAELGWTIRGRRADGRSFTLTHGDRYASETDVSYETGFDLFDQLAQIHFNDVEEVTIEDVSTTSTMTRDYAASTIAQVQIRAGRRWQPLRTDRVLYLRANRTVRLRVLLTSARLPDTWVRVDVPVPARIGRKSGYLEVLGGNSYFPGGEGGQPPGDGTEFAEAGYVAATAPASFEALLRGLRQSPRNDQVLANLSLYRPNGSMLGRSGRAGTGSVVDGMVTVEVQGLG